MDKSDRVVDWAVMLIVVAVLGFGLYWAIVHMMA